MNRSINLRCYDMVSIIIIVIFLFISYKTDYLKSVGAFVSGLLFLIRALLQKFSIIQKKSRITGKINPLCVELIIAASMFSCSYVWFANPDNDFGFVFLILALIVKMYFEQKE